MKKKFISKGIILMLLLSSVALACDRKDKQTVLADNVSVEAKQDENEIQRDILLGDKYLQQDKYEDAKQYYEKAISLDKGNKKTYLTIKDKYLEKGRLDDAYYIIKLAVQNNVDTENMNKVLEQIRGKFEIVNIKDHIRTNDKYTLPSEVTVKINNVDTKVPVKWNSNPAVDTSKAGKFSYEGNCVQYERKVKVALDIQLKVNSPEEAQKIINKLKTSDNMRFDYLKDTTGIDVGENYYVFQWVFILGDGTEDGGDIGHIRFVEKTTGDIYKYDMSKYKGQGIKIPLIKVK